MLFCSGKRNNGRPYLYRSGGLNRYRGLFVAISRILLSRQSANFEGFRLASSSYNRSAAFQEPARWFPPERRKTHRRQIRDGWETISTIVPFESFSFAIASASRHCLYYRFKAFRPSSPRLSFIDLKHRLRETLFAHPRFLPLIPLCDISEITLKFIVTGDKTGYLRV